MSKPTIKESLSRIGRSSAEHAKVVGRAFASFRETGLVAKNELDKHDGFTGLKNEVVASTRKVAATAGTKLTEFGGTVSDKAVKFGTKVSDRFGDASAKSDEDDKGDSDDDSDDDAAAHPVAEEDGPGGEAEYSEAYIAELREAARKRIGALQRKAAVAGANLLASASGKGKVSESDAYSAFAKSLQEIDDTCKSFGEKINEASSHVRKGDCDIPSVPELEEEVSSHVRKEGRATGAKTAKDDGDRTEKKTQSGENLKKVYRESAHLLARYIRETPDHHYDISGIAGNSLRTAINRVKKAVEEENDKEDK